MKRASSLLAASLAVGAVVGFASGDLGDFIPPPIDVQAQTGETGSLGVQFLNDQYFVSTRGLVVPPHKVYIFDAAGVMTGNFDQHTAAQPNAWGYRDGATDGTFLYFGCEDGMFRHNADGSGATQIISGGGPNGNYRANAYDPSLDGGNGGFWSCSFDTSLVAVSMTGAVLTTFPNLDSWSLYGLELDPLTGNLWGHHGIRPAGGHPPPEIWEIDTTTGRTTGVAWQSDAGVPGTPPDYPLNGGLTLVPGGALGSGDDYDLMALLQAESDTLVAFELYSGGPTEKWLDGPEYDPLLPVADPRVHPWHEIKPVFCTWWDASAWVDNGTGDLDVCDYIQLTDGAHTDWWHVDLVTFTVILEEIEGGPVEDWIYYDWANPPYNGPLGTWVEIHPNFNQIHEAVDWIDGGNGILDLCDWLIFDEPGGQIFLHVVGVATDLVLHEEDPPNPCPEDINGDGLVNVLDLLAVLAAWGNTGGPEDVNGDGIVNVLDLLAILSAWGPC